MQAQWTDDVAGCPPLDKLSLSCVVLLCTGIEQEAVSALQAVGHMNALLAAVACILDVEGAKVMGEMSSVVSVLASVLTSTRALFMHLPAACAAVYCDISISRSVVTLLKVLVRSQYSGSGSNTGLQEGAAPLQWASLGWYVCQNVLAASTCGGLVNVHSEAFIGAQLPDMLEELVVDCCDVVADRGAPSETHVVQSRSLFTLQAHAGLLACQNACLSLKTHQHGRRHAQWWMYDAGTEAASGVLEIAVNCTWTLATWECHGGTELRRLCSCVTQIHEVSEVRCMGDRSLEVLRSVLNLKFDT